MSKVTIHRKVEAEQWLPGSVVSTTNPPAIDLLPAGVHLCRPEIQWSQGRELVYFTYAEFQAHHWMEVAKHDMPAEGSPIAGVMESGIVVMPKNGAPYYRKLLPFVFWSIKSEASAMRNHSAVFLDKDNQQMVDLFLDYCFAEKWPVADGVVPARAEYRVTDGSYGRGYRPIYMKPTEWLLHEQVPYGHDNLGMRDTVTVVTNAEFVAMRLLT